MAQLIDDLDKQILQYLCEGIYSYDDLAKKCGITRNTVYRRISSLEKNGFIVRTTRVQLDYDKLGIAAIGFGIYVPPSSVEKAISSLKNQAKVNLLWRAFGRHNIVFTTFCERGQEGSVINYFKEVFEHLSATDVDISVGFVWEKTQFCPDIQKST